MRSSLAFTHLLKRQLRFNREIIFEEDKDDPTKVDVTCRNYQDKSKECYLKWEHAEKLKSYEVVYLYNIVEIQSRAFNNASVVKVFDSSGSVRDIWNYAFHNCYHLEQINFPKANIENSHYNICDNSNGDPCTIKILKGYNSLNPFSEQFFNNFPNLVEADAFGCEEAVRHLDILPTTVAPLNGNLPVR